MRKLVSFFGRQTNTFEKLNQQAAEYAHKKQIEFIWKPMDSFCRESVVLALNEADAGLIDVEPYNDDIFMHLNQRCRLLIRFGVGYDNVNLGQASKHGIAVARTTGTNKTGVAEMALTHILGAQRKMRIYRKKMELGDWEKEPGHELTGKRVGILGFGHVGAELAKLLSGFDCKILAYDICPDMDRAKKLGVRFAELDEIFKTCDAISVHLPYNSQTHHMVDQMRLEQMKPDAVLSCTARGRIIDEKALFDVLYNHKIGGAGLDVYETEPYPVHGKLLELDNIILTPHGASQTMESLAATYKKAVDLMDDFFSGRLLAQEDLLNPDYVKKV